MLDCYEFVECGVLTLPHAGLHAENKMVRNYNKKTVRESGMSLNITEAAVKILKNKRKLILCILIL